MTGKRYFMYQELVSKESGSDGNRNCQFATGLHLFRPVLLDMVGEVAQRGEYFGVMLVIRTQLNAVLLGQNQGNFQHIDGVYPEAFVPIERRKRINFLEACIQIQRSDNVLR